MASVASIRHTVLRLIGLPNGSLGAYRDVGQRLPAQRLLGFRHQFAGHRLDQRVVQGGKTGVTPPSRLIVQAEVPCGPSLPPVADRVGVQTHLRSRLHMR